MKKSNPTPLVVDSIADLLRIMELPAPEHPLISLVRFESIRHVPAAMPSHVVLNFFSIWLKKGFIGKMKYGHQPYDFDAGIMSFFSPGQVLTSEVDGELDHSGWWLIIHPDFLWSFPLAGTIRKYGFFYYSVSEALHLSVKEEKMINGILENIWEEYRMPIDAFSQPAIISQVETLLVYGDRFYHRQFITRKKGNNTVLNKLEDLLSDYMNSDQLLESGIPTVKYVSKELQLSPNYLSDLLRSLTGQSTQQHIYNKVIEMAGDQLSSTNLSVSEIAYNLGFTYPQSFSKLFKNKTSLSPLQFRARFQEKN